MDLYIYIDGSDLEEMADGISSSINDWLIKSNTKADMVNHVHGRNETQRDVDLPDWDLGINIKISKGRDLKGPLNFLYGLAKEYKREFVLGIVHKEGEIKEDICFFGYEEGKPDFYEISSYLGIKI
jgi:hypothetical protein